MIDMKFTHHDQIAYTKLALMALEGESNSPADIEAILNFGELIKKYADDENAVIYDATEYVYEQLRLARNEEGAFDDVELRATLEGYVKPLV